MSRRWAATPMADVLLGLLLALLTGLASMTRVGPSGPAERTPDAYAVVLLVVVAVALAVRRRVPVTALLLTNVMTVLWYLIGYHGRLITLAPLIACYTLAAHRGWRWGAAGWAFTGFSTMLAVRLTFDTGWFSDQVLNALMLEFAAVAAGAAVHYYRAFAESAREQAIRIAETKAEHDRRQAAEQRLAIARELHDVFGHTMAAVSVQAGVAMHVMQRRPEQAAQALAIIKRISDDGLDEVRSLLTVLRGGQPPPGAADGLSKLDSLLDVTRASGLLVDLTVTGNQWPVPEPVDRAAYRIVQESLTNVRRHATATTVTLNLDYSPAALDILVRDDGKPLPGFEPGQGIAGMRARAAALGGTLEAGPHPQGGFAVRSTLPWHRETP